MTVLIERQRGRVGRKAVQAGEAAQHNPGVPTPPHGGTLRRYGRPLRREAATQREAALRRGAARREAARFF